MKIDHILIRVDNLQNAVSDFEDLGFKVYYGSNKKTCHHAMIYFRDGSFLELIDQTKFPGIFTFLAKMGILNLFGVVFKRFAHYCVSKERFLDYSILAEDIDAFYQRSKDKSPSKLMEMKRKNHSDEVVKWKLFAFDNLTLPFVMSEYVPYRMPDKEAFIHKNGVLSISQIEICVKDTEKHINDFQNCFGISSFSEDTIEMVDSKITLEASEHHRIKSVTLLSEKVDDNLKARLANYHIKLVENES